MYRSTGFLLASILMSYLAASAVAIPVYTYTTDASSYSAPAGQPVQVHIYLMEGGGGSLIASRGGLFVAGFAVNLAPGQTNAGTLAAIRGDSTNFDGGFSPDPANSATRVRGDNMIIPTDASGPTPTMNLISIGYVTVDASAVVNTVTTYRLGAYSPGNEGYTEVNQSPYDDLDVTNNGGSGSDIYTGAGGTAANPVAYDNTFTVTASAPEPSSLISLLIALPLLAQRYRRER